MSKAPSQFSDPEPVARRVTILGNYSSSPQFSMHEYARLLETALCGDRYSLNLWNPPTFAGRLFGDHNKVALNIDTFLLAPWCIPSSELTIIADQANAIYVPFLKRGKSIVICHDLIPQLFQVGQLKGWRPSTLGNLRIAWQNGGLEKADHVVCVSEATRQDLLAYTNVHPNRCSVIMNCMTKRLVDLPPEEIVVRLKALGVSQETPFILAFGKSPYKNAAGSVRIFSRTHRQIQKALQLVLIGDWQSQGTREAEHLGISESVSVLSRISDRDLSALYKSTKALLFPSLYEGFGWPILEAQEAGVPIVASNAASIPEVAGQGARLVPHGNENALAVALTEVLESTDEQLRLVDHGKSNLKRFGFDQWAEKITALTEKIVN